MSGPICTFLCGLPPSLGLTMTFFHHILNFYSYTVLLSDVLLRLQLISLGGLGVTCLPRDPRFAGSNSAEVDGFF